MYKFLNLAKLRYHKGLMLLVRANRNTCANRAFYER